MTTKTFAARFPEAEMSWMNDELPMWIRRQLLQLDMEVMILASQARSYVCEELLCDCLPGAAHQA